MPNVNDPNQGYRPSVQFRYDGSRVTEICIILSPDDKGGHVIADPCVEPFLAKWQELRVDEQPKFLRDYIEMWPRPRHSEPEAAKPEQSNGAMPERLLVKRLDSLLYRVNELEDAVEALRAEREANPVVMIREGKPVVLWPRSDGALTQERLYEAFQRFQQEQSRHSGLP